MAQVEPPPTIVRIVEVLDPGGNHYVVYVRMPQHLANKFPDRAWGTKITDIGLAEKDITRFTDHVLVGIEPISERRAGDSADLFWKFQKLSGPAYTTTSNSRDNLTPQKYRGQTVVVKTEQEVDPDTAPTALAGDLVSSMVAQTPNTGKAVLSEVTETIDENSAALEGQQFAPDGTLLATSEVLVNDGTDPAKGFEVRESTVEPLGNGKSVKQTSTAKKRAVVDSTDTTVDGWPKKQKKSKGTDNLTPQKYRGQTVTSMTTEQVELSAANVDNIPDPASPVYPQTVIEHEKVNDYRYEKRTVTEAIDENSAALEGQQFAPDGTLIATSEVLVNDGADPEKGFGVRESTVEPLGNGKSVKQTSTAKKRAVVGSTDTTVDGWPKKQKKSKGTDNLTPQKYRGQTVTSVTTEQVELAASNVNDIPAPATPSGDQTVIEHEKVNDYRYEKRTVTETIAENLVPLKGEEYGEIVTKSVSEVLVNSETNGVPTPADSGFTVISSVVQPLGNGKSVKETKTAKGGWPDPINKEVSKEGADMPPPRYRKDLTRTKTTRKIAASAVPSTPSLSGNEVAKTYQKETPDRAEESVVTQSFTLNTSSVDEAVEQKPFVSIRSRMTPGTAPVVPASGNGSAKLVYEAPNGSKIYENVEEIATVRPGPAGSEKDEKPFVKIETKKRYSPNADVATKMGSANIVFNDGKVQVYEVSEVTSTAKFGPAGAEQQTKPFVSITSTKTYQSTGTLGGGEVGSTNKIYDDGTAIVYEKSVDTAVARPGPAGTEKDEKPFVKIETKKRYSPNADVATKTGSANIVFNDGKVQVYEVSEVTSTAKLGPAGAEQQTKPFVRITSTKTYVGDGNLGAGEVGSTNKIYDDGSAIVYEKSVETAVARPGPAGTEKDEKPYVSLTTNKKYSASPSIGTRTGSSNVVFNDGSVQVYEVGEVTATPKSGLKGIETNAQQWGSIVTTTNFGTSSTPPAGGSTQIVYSDGAVSVYETSTVRATVGGSTKDVDAQEWGSVIWNGTYASSSSGDRSKQVWRLGTDSVFLNETAELKINGGSFVSAKESNAVLTETQRTSYGTAPEESKNSRSRVVYQIGEKKVYENITIERVPKAPRTYAGVVNVDLPPIYLGFSYNAIKRRDAQDQFLYLPNVIPGYRGAVACEVKESWSENPGSTEKPTVMQPTPISFDSPLGGFNVGPCLHTTVTITANVGSKHPVYSTGSYPMTFPGTNPPTWVGRRIVADVETQPYRDGYLTRVYTVQL